MSFAISPAFADSAVFYGPRPWGQVHPRQNIFPIPKVNFVQIYLVGEIPGNLVVLQPLQVNIEQDEDGAYVASDDLFLVYGDGDDRYSAIKDYALSLVEFYRLLEKGSATNIFDKKLFDYLQTYLQPKPLRGYDAIQTNRD